MAQEILWSLRALKEFDAILEYWEEKNQSDLYSKKLSKQIIKSVEKIGKFIYIGKEIEDDNARVLQSGNYSIFYEIGKNEIIILCIWDNRRNPNSFKIIQSVV